VNPVPVIVTELPPPTGPELGDTPLIVGRYRYLSAVTICDVPPATVTQTLICPLAAAAGTVTVICVGEFTVNVDAFTVPNRTAVAPVNPVPVIVTELPPPTGPELGDTPLIVGAEEPTVTL
jgi:hypothetical protein